MKQATQFPFVGSTDEFTFYKNKDGKFVRPKSPGISKNRIDTDPKFVKVKKNYTQFRQVMNAMKLINAAFRQMIANAKSGSGPRRRLSSLLFTIIKTDKSNATGSKQFSKADISMLKQFQFSDKANLDSRLYAKYTTTVNRTTGMVEVAVASFVPVTALNPPPAATHFRIVMSAAEFGFDNQTENAKQADSGHTLINRDESPVFNLRAPLTPDNTYIIMIVLGVEFYEEVDQELILLTPTPLAIIDVSKP